MTAGVPAPATWTLEVLDGLRASLDSTLADAGAPVCYCAIVPANEVAADHCGCGTTGCGMGWVRLARVYHSSRFPTPDVAPPNLDVLGPLAATVDVGVLRCLPQGNGRDVPTAVDAINATLGQVADMQRIHDAILCAPAVKGRTRVMGAYQPISSGDCGGAFWQVTVQLRPARNPARSS